MIREHLSQVHAQRESQFPGRGKPEGCGLDSPVAYSGASAPIRVTRKQATGEAASRSLGGASTLRRETRAPVTGETAPTEGFTPNRICFPVGRRFPNERKCGAHEASEKLQGSQRSHECFPRPGDWR